jgi:hypothetical protein
MGRGPIGGCESVAGLAPPAHTAMEYGVSITESTASWTFSRSETLFRASHDDLGILYHRGEPEISHQLPDIMPAGSTIS